jgi:predicted nucleotidyltransferase component of viral defense system
MIPEAEIRRLAAQWQVDPMVLNLDYCLTWLLSALSTTTGDPERLRLKGGTCLRKCYFAGYRFSEDLDFTATAHLAPQSLTGWFEQAIRWSAERDGPNFAASPYRLETVDDEYGQESYQMRIYFHGPLQWGGSPPAIRLDITRGERLLLPAESRPLIHPYSDAPLFAGTRVACYALLEVLAEKLRALGGQRRFAISRDLYDIYHLVQTGIAVERLALLLPGKFHAQGMDVAALDVSQLEQRRADYELDWRRRLTYLIPSSQAVSFDQAWSTALDLILRVKTLLPG